MVINLSLPELCAPTSLVRLELCLGGFQVLGEVAYTGLIVGGALLLGHLQYLGEPLILFDHLVNLRAQGSHKRFVLVAIDLIFSELNLSRY